MQRTNLEELIHQEETTYTELEALYNKCKGSLEEFNRIFQTKSEALNKRELESLKSLNQLSGLSKDIQGLSQRVILLEDKIDCVAKTIRTSQDRTVEAKLLPGQKKTDGDDKKLMPGCSNSRRNATRSPTCSALTRQPSPRSYSQKASVVSGGGGPKLLGGEAENKTLQATAVTETNPSKTKEVSWSKEAARTTIPGKSSHSPALPVKRVEKSKICRKATTPTPAAPHSSAGAARPDPLAVNCSAMPDSFDKVYKQIPELLSKFEEFHRSFSRACDAGQQIEPDTADDILKVMDGHLRLLENLECRLSGVLNKDSGEDERGKR